MQSNLMGRALRTLIRRKIAVAAILVMISLVAGGCILPRKHPDKHEATRKGKKKK